MHKIDLEEDSNLTKVWSSKDSQNYHRTLGTGAKQDLEVN